MVLDWLIMGKMVVNFYDQWMTNDVFHVGETISQTTHDWEWWGHGGVMVLQKTTSKDGDG